MSASIVFVIGAGASGEARLRTGQAFKNHIAQLLDLRYDSLRSQLKQGDETILAALKQFVGQPGKNKENLGSYQKAAWLIRDALPLAISIDNLIDAHRGDDRIAICGKLAIVRSILDSERQSVLHYDDMQGESLRLQPLEATWYPQFFKLLTENCEKNDIAERFRSLTLIIFNYDRCVEHFLFNALQIYYGIPAGEAISFVNSISVFHPYGVVGNLPWAAGEVKMAFGAEPRSQELLTLSQGIKTFTEGTDPDASEISEIRERMHGAERVVFLGFAFHALNMRLLAQDQASAASGKTVTCFATTHGISASDDGVVQRQIRDLYSHTGVGVNTASLTCADFFAEYWRSLTF